MILDQVSFVGLKVFESVYRLKNMTKAANELHMTQSGVSQHIKNLEFILDIVLFDRVKKSIIPTSQATEIFEKIIPQLNNMEDILIDIQGGHKTFRGKITLGIPIEFGNNIILPLLTKWAKRNPNVEFDIKYGHASQLGGLLKTGELDFAIVDTFGFDKHILTVNLGRETLKLCSSKQYLKSKKIKENPTYKEFSNFDYVDYIEGAPLLKMWFSHHYKGKIPNISLKACLMDVQGMAQMIIQGMGIGILPKHMIKKLEKQGIELHSFDASGKPLFNELNLAYLDGKSMSLGCSDLVEYLLENLSKK